MVDVGETIAIMVLFLGSSFILVKKTRKSKKYLKKKRNFESVIQAASVSRSFVSEFLTSINFTSTNFDAEVEFFGGKLDPNKNACLDQVSTCLIIAANQETGDKNENRR